MRDSKAANICHHKYGTYDLKLHLHRPTSATVLLVKHNIHSDEISYPKDSDDETNKIKTKFRSFDLLLDVGND